MLRRIALLLVLLTAGTATSQATELEIALSDEMAEVLLIGEQSRTDTQGTRFGGGLLYNDDRDLLGTLFLQVTNRGEWRWQPLTFGLGAKVYAADLDRPDETVGALGLGGDVGVGIPAQIPLAVVFTGYLSPTITTFGDAERLTEFMVRLEGEITRGAHAFLGYRQLKVHSDDFRDVHLDKGLHAGIRLSF